MFRENVVRIAFGVSDVKGAISLHRVLLQSSSVRGGGGSGGGGGGGGGGDDRRKKVLLVSPILPECKLQPPPGADSLNECLSTSFLPIYLFPRHDPSDDIVPFSEKYTVAR